MNKLFCYKGDHLHIKIESNFLYFKINFLILFNIYSISKQNHMFSTMKINLVNHKYLSHNQKINVRRKRISYYIDARKNLVKYIKHYTLE